MKARFVIISALLVFGTFLTGGLASDARAHPVVESINEWHKIPRLKRSVIVRLSEAVSLEELEQIGAEIRSQDPAYQRLFIEYYLPGMKEGSGAWGITHWTPEKDIRIFGNIQEFDDSLESELDEIFLNAD